MPQSSPDGRFTILLGGSLTLTQRLLAQSANSRCIAADGGMSHAPALALQPELWVGDFDSAPPELLKAHPAIPRETYRADKAMTDGEIAVEAALKRGARHLLLAGGLGGQTDHALGHLALMLALAGRGIPVLASSGLEEAYPLCGGALTLDLPAGSRLSVIAFTDLSALTIRGVRWPLETASIAAGSTRTLSNEATGDVELRLEKGRAIVMAYPAGA